MLILPIGTIPDKVPADTLVSVLKRRLKREKDVSIRRFIYAKLDALREDYSVVQSGDTSSDSSDPFLVCC